jgi:hypothetical protein
LAHVGRVQVFRHFRRWPARSDDGNVAQRRCHELATCEVARYHVTESDVDAAAARRFALCRQCVELEIRVARLADVVVAEVGEDRQAARFGIAESVLALHYKARWGFKLSCALNCWLDWHLRPEEVDLDRHAALECPDPALPMGSGNCRRGKSSRSL